MRRAQFPPIKDAWTTPGVSHPNGEIYSGKARTRGTILVDRQYAVQLMDSSRFSPFPDCYLVGDEAFLLNADHGSTSRSYRKLLKSAKIYGISFNCLSQFKLLTPLREGRLIVIDGTTDDVVRITNPGYYKRHSRIFNSVEGILPPQPSLGHRVIRIFSDSGAVSNLAWHRPGHVLVSYRNRHYLFGQDDGQYFGVELAQPARTVRQALNSLQPKELQGKSVTRQGDWYIVRCSPPKCVVHKIFPNHRNGYTMALPNTRGENGHLIQAEVAIDSRGMIYAHRGCLSHAQHRNVEFKGWVRFVRNTAVRSVSQYGVD